ncbi:hypothetical protein EVAR_24413_1 [Eumeta japonica]|uniref:Uncharacterized protein n=1 Tax=Eumeta variegata TaxID=151549 RepID=A0A4C1VUG5_EUMVA|nr:hypothetical protein EVAR_24413_1 [Eumeta japonica]
MHHKLGDLLLDVEIVRTLYTSNGGVILPNPQPRSPCTARMSRFYTTAINIIAPTSTSTTEVPTTPSPLAAYRLEDYPWARGLIDLTRNTLLLRDGTVVTLRLA